jgi:RNA polymerase sigma factor (sigma-70 family)
MRQLPLADPATASAVVTWTSNWMSDDAVKDLLERLSSGRVDAAWSEFLARYSPLIMHVIRRHRADDDVTAECFIHVCAALSDNGFHRLLSFRPDGPARFKTWLMAVVSNLCVDWRRKEQGRVRPFQSVARLPELDQQVYLCIYVRRMSRAQCVQALKPRFPGLTEATVSEINARLFATLTPHQRWLLSVRPPALKPVPSGAGTEDDDPAWEMATPGPGPDDQAADSQERRQLEDALSKLPAEQRLLLALRYEQDLTLAEIARLTGRPDPFRVNREVQTALDALGSLMGSRRSRPDRKTR